MLQKTIAMRETVLHSIFLDLREAYDALDKKLCLNILSGYGSGTRTIHILKTYWSWLQIADKAGGGLRARLPETPWGNSWGPPVAHNI